MTRRMPKLGLCRQAHALAGLRSVRILKLGMKRSTYRVALRCGVIAGLRTFMAPAAVTWAVHLGRLDLKRSRLAFLGRGWVRWLVTGLALVELVVDQLPATPSRTVPPQFVGRLITGTLSGATVGAATDRAGGGALAALGSAVSGTLGGSRARARLARAFHNDHPAALIEDTVAIGGAALVGIGGR